MRLWHPQQHSLRCSNLRLAERAAVASSEAHVLLSSTLCGACQQAPWHHKTPATWLLEKRCQRFEADQRLEAAKTAHARQARAAHLLAPGAEELHGFDLALIIIIPPKVHALVYLQQ